MGGVYENRLKFFAGNLQVNLLFFFITLKPRVE